MEVDRGTVRVDVVLECGWRVAAYHGVDLHRRVGCTVAIYVKVHVKRPRQFAVLRALVRAAGERLREGARDRGEEHLGKDDEIF